MEKEEVTNKPQPRHVKFATEVQNKYDCSTMMTTEMIAMVACVEKVEVPNKPHPQHVKFATKVQKISFRVHLRTMMNMNAMIACRGRW